MNKTSAIIFFGIILIGLGLSLLYFKRESGEPASPVETDAPLVQTDSEDTRTPQDHDAPETAEAALTTPDGAAGSAAPEAPGAASAATDGSFDSPAAALTALREVLSQRAFDAVVDFVGPQAVPEAMTDAVRSLIEAPDFELDVEGPFREVSKSADASRWAMNFVPETGEAARQLYVDLQALEGGRVAVSGLSLPMEIPATVRGSGPVEAGDAPGEPAAPDFAPGADALSVAHAFSKAVVGRNFAVARALADPASVTDERVAALMIAVEEGGFELREDRPLVVTLSREDLTWVLTRIQSEDAGSEFALELGQVSDAWKVNGLTFSKVLSSLASAAGGGEVAYSPIVENPAGGDSLVIYFEFDDAGVNERGMRQLSVIADILKQGEDRVIRINGHADALGSDQYNKVLSDRRASAIRQGLLSFGVSPRQVITEAFGDTLPRRPNFNPDGTDNPSGRSENRRAEVYLDF